MFRKLLIVFVSAAVLSIVAFTGAWMVGGEDFRREFTQNDSWSWTIDEDEDLGPVESRNFALESGSRIAMDVPVELRFSRADTRTMIVKGPAELLKKLVWKDGRLSLKGHANHWRHNLKVVITAPEIERLELDAPGDVKMTGLSQEQFTLEANGAVDFEAKGKVRKVFVTSSGASDIDLRHVLGEDATIEINGVGDVTVGPTRLADIEINGAGDVTLVRKPEILRSRINGIGTVDHDY